MKVSMADAAYNLLREVGEPLHYAYMVNALLERGAISSNGLTPGSSLLAAILSENAACVNRAEIPRFDALGNGVYGLVEWRSTGIEQQIQEINRSTRDSLRELVANMSPATFEDLIGNLLIKLGFDQETVEVVGQSGDGGIDVVGVMDIEGVTRIDVAVQVKRVKANISPDKIRSLRGSLMPNQRGIFITTSKFSAQSAQEANAIGKSPISLVNGEQLLDLLFKHSIGVVSQKHIVYEIDGTYWPEAPLESVIIPPTANGHQKISMQMSVTYPLRIFVRHRTQGLIEASLLETGNVIWNGQTYSSVSSAGMAVTGWKSCNGWSFWMFNNPTDGQDYLIDVLRKPT